VDWPHITKERPRALQSSPNVEPTRLQKERKAKEQLAEKHINRSWEKELEGAEIYCQRQEKVEGTRRQPMFLMEQWTLYILPAKRCGNLSGSSTASRSNFFVSPSPATVSSPPAVGTCLVASIELRRAALSETRLVECSPV
jgi:hypothetical protein